MFRIAGLVTPAIVAGSIYIFAEAVPQGSKVVFYIDDKPTDIEYQAPYWLGGMEDSKPKGFQTEGVGYGDHIIWALASDPVKNNYRSNVIEIHVIPSNNKSFSETLTPYVSSLLTWTVDLKMSVRQNLVAGSLANPREEDLRQSIIDMYRNWGIDLFLDSGSDQSAVLRSLAPENWASPSEYFLYRPWSRVFSPDAVFYHAIPSEWPRVALPNGYIHNVQLNTAYGGDGIGFGQVVADASSTTLTVRSQWYDVKSTLRIIPFQIPSGWPRSLPSTAAGDRHVIFIDPQKKLFVSTYRARVDPFNKGPSALYAAGPTSFDSMGDHGGSIAANFAELPLLIQPGESTNLTKPIGHAIGGPVRRVWAARVYPASAWDAGVRTAKDSCSGKGYMNTGLIPYGGVIQLDPALDLNALKLSLPAFRILQAMQTYGYYVMDYGCADLDIYTALDASELAPYGGLWGSSTGVGVQNEVQRVLSTSTLYVVAPIIKKK